MTNFNLSHWNPFKELEMLQQRIHSSLGRGELLGSLPTTPANASREAMAMADWSPKVDVIEDAERYLVKAELPEVRKEDITVSVRDGILTLKGERKFEKEEKNKKYHRIERAYGSFFRSFQLPEDVDASRIDANFKDGMLSVSILKAPFKSPAQIDVKIN